MKFELSWQILKKNSQMSYFTKIRPVGVTYFHVDGQTGRIDMTKLIVAFRSFMKTCLKHRVSGQESLD